MSTDTVELFIPCEVINVQVTVAPSGTLTDIEQIFVRALAEPGVDSLDTLTQLFGLGHRPTFDLVLDLWRRGYIEVIEPGSRLVLSELSRVSIAGGKLHEAPGTARSEYTEQVMRELVSGHFLDVQPSARLPIGSRTAPALLAAGTLSNDDRPALIKLLERRPRETFGKRPQRLLAAYLPINAGSVLTPSTSRTMRVLSRVWRDTTSGRIYFDIIHPTEVPQHVRRDLANALTDLSAERPGDVFFKQLGELTAKNAPRESDIDELTDRLATKVANIGDVSIGNSPQIHEDYQALASTIEGVLHETDASDLETSVVAGAAAIVDQLLNAIAQTRKQLVMVCPFLDLRGYQRFRDALASLLERASVDVFLLWGVDHQATLPEPVGLAFEALAKKAQLGRLHFVRLPTRTHAKIAIRDDDWALVCSHNYLNWQENPLAELGLIVQHPNRGPCNPALRLLRWAAAVFPDYSVGRLLNCTAPSFDHDVPEPNGSSILNQVPGATSGLGSPEAAAMFRIWRSEWPRYVHDLQRRVDGTSQKLCRVVLNEDHRVALWRALRTCRRRLLIASDQLSTDVVDERFLYTLRKRLDEVPELEVTLIFHRSRSMSALQGLAQQRPGRLTLIQAESHAKVLAWDNAALVSSFNFLSFEGVYQGFDRHRVRSEIGLLMTGADLYPQLFLALAQQIPQLRALQRRQVVSPLAASAPAQEAPDTPNAGAGRPHEAAMSLLRSLEQISDPALRLNEVAIRLSNFETASVARQAVMDLEAAEFDAEVMEVAVAAMLVRNDVDWTQPENQRWLLWAAGRAWQGGRRFESASLLQAALETPDPSRLPCLSVVELAAVIDDQAAATARFASIAQQVEARDDKKCAAILAATVVARDGNPAAALTLDAWKSELDAPVGDWIRHIADYWQETGQGLPLAEVRAYVDNREAIAYASEQREEAVRLIRVEVTRIERNIHDFAVGRLTWPELFGPQKPMEILLSYAQDNNTQAAIQWLKENGENDRELAVLIDRASDRGTRGTKHSGEHIDGTRRRNALTTLRNIVRAGRDWVDNWPSIPIADVERLQLAIRLGRALAPTREAIEQLMEAQAQRQSGDAPLIDSLFHTLEPLLRLTAILDEARRA